MLLQFQPKAGHQLEVRWEEDETWDYRKSKEPHDMQGELRTTLVLRWDFETRLKGALATGSFVAATYAGKGVKEGTPFDYDVVWARDAGFSKGKDSEAVAKWLGEEVEEQVRYQVDARVAASPGEC